MSLLGWIVAVVFTAGLLVAGCVALANDDDDAFGGVRVIQLADHEYDDGCWDGRCSGYDERNGGGYGDGRGGDGRFGGGRSGDYDGGDGDGDRCRNVCNNTFPMPMPGGGERR